MSDDIEDGDCNVCAIEDEGYCDSPEFCHEKIVKARKPHKCCECHDEIPAGAKYESCTGKWDGDLQTYKTCMLCVEIRNKFSCHGSWTFTTAWEQLRDNLFERMTTGCLKGLSAAAKQKVVDAWREWKGFED